MKVKLKFVDFFSGFDQEKNDIYVFLSRFFNLEISNRPDFIVFSVWGNSHLKYNCTKIFFTGENIRPNFYLCDYAVGFDFIEKQNYLRLPLYVYWKKFDSKKLIFPNYQNIIKNHPKSKFCCFLVSNPKASERINFFHKLNQYQKVDSGGKVENNLGYLVINKLYFMSPYKFMIAYENSSFPGYVTEKVYECFFTNTIPIYWGSVEINKDFNSSRILNRSDFRTDEDLIDKIKFLNENHDEYLKFISQPIFNSNIENKYLDEARVKNFFEGIFIGNKKSNSVGLRKLIGILKRKKINFLQKHFFPKI